MHHDNTEKSLQEQLAEAQKRIVQLESLVDASLLEAEKKLQSTERITQALFDSSSHPMLVIDRSGTTLAINRSAANQLGWEPSQVLGRCVYDFLPPDIAKRREAWTHEVIRTGKLVRFEDQVQGKWFDNKGYPIPDASGQITRILVSADDITERKAGAKKLRESETMLARAQEIAHVGHWELDLSSQKASWSDEMYRIFGLKPQECDVYVGFVLGFVHADDRARIEKALQDASEGVQPYDETYRIVRVDGTIRWVHSKGELTRAADGAPLRFFGTVLDITGLKQMEEALRESTKTATAILNASWDSITLIDTSGLVLAVNGASAQRFGIKPSEMIGRCIYDFVPPDLAATRRAFAEQVIRTGKPVTWEDERAGRCYEITEYPINDEAGHVARIVIYANDITERKQMEEKLQKSHAELELRVKERTRELAQFAAAVDNAIDGIVLCDGYKIFYANRAFERMTGYLSQELIGKDVMMFRSDAKPRLFYDDIREGVSRHRTWAGVYPARKKDGETIYLEARESTIKDTSSLVVICRDITDKLRLEEELRHAHKMEAIGTLAGGVAHDFNNILAAILGFGEIALEDTEQPHVEDSLRQVISAALRGRELVRQILTFSRKTTREKKIVDLAPVVRESLNLLRATLPSTININLSMSAENYIARADLNGIQQILLNICTNAAHAMPDGGELSVSVSEVKFTTRRLLPECDLKLGQYLALSFTDTGTGMDRTVLSRVFEPFFTTKGSGQGTGMGLAVVYGIIKDHGGAITAESSPGKGSTFVVYLPIIHDTAEAEAPIAEPAITGGHERILFVDDETSIAAMAHQILTRLGYTVVVVTEPSQALEVFRTDPQAFDLVITDQTMPNFTGLTLAKKLLALRSDLPIILSTGYSEAVSPDKLRKVGIRQLLMKPLQRKEWAQTIRRVLDVEKLDLTLKR